MTGEQSDRLAHRWIVREGYDEVGETYAADRESDGDERALVERVVDRLDDGARLLDAGCGDGTAVAGPAADLGCEVVGLDISAGQLELASEHRHDEAFVQGDLTRLPFPADSFDAVCSLHAIIHVPREEHRDVFEEWARVLAPGGQLLASVGAGGWEGRNPDWLSAGAEMRWSFYGADRYRELLERAGFDLREEALLGDELGGGEWLYLLARAP